MKIIFDSEEQYKDFIDSKCAREFVTCDTQCSVLYHPCAECWKNSGVEMEVKEDDEND